jgi:anaerobic C4-dicarboxylate transporter
MWIASACPVFVVQGRLHTPTWSNILTLASLAASMTVNALVTGLIVFRIFKVFREVKDDTGGRKLRSIIFIIIESGMALFAIQLARLVVAATGERTNAELDIYPLIAGIHEMLNVVISSVIATLYSTDNVAARV